MAKKESEVEEIVSIISTELSKLSCPEDVIKESCLFPFLMTKCKNDSLNDMGMHFKLYNVIFDVVSKLVKRPGLLGLFAENYNGKSLYSLLEKMYQRSKMVKTMAKNINDLQESVETTVAQPQMRYTFQKKGTRGHVSSNAGKDFAFKLAP